MMLQLNAVSKAFVHQTVLDGVTLQVGAQSRVGLIGRNGSGKSTLLRMIMGQLEPDSGTISRTPGLHINCLTQEPQVTPDNTLEAELKSVFTDINGALAEEAELLTHIETLTGEAQMKALHRLDTVHRDLERLDARDVDAKISRMITGLGFALSDLERRVAEFSGGWQMRINLAKVLLEGADILLLDEPTNHLDLRACEWLESFLKEYPGGLVVVSHDRAFLDAVVTDIAEVELAHLTLFPGNYTRFLQQKAELIERQTAAAERQHKELAKQTAFVERFRASATRSTQAKSREKQLAKIERLEAPKTNNQRMAVNIPVPQASGKQVITIRKVAKAFGDNRLFDAVDADIQRHQRIFLLGENGSGKTTLLRLILQLDSPDGGEIRLGHNALPGYFAQNQLETLDPDINVFDTIQNACPKLTNTEVRNLLGRFLFSGDEVFKPVSVLSGGEKSKLALAKLMLSGPNMLLLDEPTNHMDIPAKEVLEEAFREYEGTILCISHDRYFIQQLATDIWELHQGQLIKYCGNYEYYLSKRDEYRARSEAENQRRQGSVISTPVVQEITPVPSQMGPMRERREMEKRLKKVEKSIVSLEEELAQLHEQLNELSLQQEYQALDTLSQSIGKKQQELTQLNTEWEQLAEALI